jgi:phosphate starvation-inducible membrane PsiE
MILGILISLGFIFLSVWSVNKLFANKTQDVLVRFILMVFAALVAVFIVDKTVAFQVSLLSEQQNAQLFELIKTLTLMIFSYYFGTQNGEQKK